ncbi:MAG: phosphoribosylglycinamide formyltransferase [Verrucomicrobiales bacterium]|nr:phosphoribosylglycinamide formyltransferase [Verrucomicrobiales bacterium]
MERLGTEIRILSLVEGKSTSATLKQLEAEEEKGESKRGPRLALLGSGTGSNVRALIDAVESGMLDAEVAVVLSDVDDSGVLQIAKEKNLPALHIDPGTQKRGRLTDAALKEIVDRLEAHRVDLVILAGFMRVIREPLLSSFPARILNVHPSLLPKFPGLNAARQALGAGETETGTTIHLVDSTIDGGKILVQATVPILEGDDEHSLQARVQEQEHRLYAKAIGEYWKTNQ